MAYVFDERNTLTGNGEPEDVVVQDVSANFFSVLGVNPILGPGFTPENGKAGHDNVLGLLFSLHPCRHTNTVLTCCALAFA